MALHLYPKLHLSLKSGHCDISMQWVQFPYFSNSVLSVCCVTTSTDCVPPVEHLGLRHSAICESKWCDTTGYSFPQQSARGRWSKTGQVCIFFSFSQSSPKSNPHWSLHFQNEWIPFKWHLNLRITNPAGNLKWLYKVCLTPSLSVPSCLFPCVPLTLLPILLWSLFFLDDQVLWAEW